MIRLGGVSCRWGKLRPAWWGRLGGEASLGEQVFCRWWGDDAGLRGSPAGGRDDAGLGGQVGEGEAGLGGFLQEQVGVRV